MANPLLPFVHWEDYLVWEVLAVVVVAVEAAVVAVEAVLVFVEY